MTHSSVWLLLVGVLSLLQLLVAALEGSEGTEAHIERNDATPKNDNNYNKDEQSPKSRDDCGLYMAVVPLPWRSRIKSQNGDDDDENGPEVLKVEERWGLFAGRDYDEAELLDAAPELSIPLLSFGSAYLDRFREGSVEQEWAHATLSVLYEYLWGGQHDSSAYEAFADESTLTMIPGIGLLSTMETKAHGKYSWVLRQNVRFDVLSVHQRHAVSDETLSATASAQTHYFNNTLTVWDESGLNAGEELVLPGLNDEEDEEDEEEDEQDEARGGEDDEETEEEHGEENEFNKILNVQHYDMLKRFVRQVRDFFRKHKDLKEKNTKQDIYHFLVTHYLEAGLGKARKDYVRRYLIPPDYETFQELFVKGRATKEADETPIFYGQPPSLSWLRSNGLCVDSKSTLHPAQSTIPNAGQGAFAARSSTRGQRILTTPLLMIPSTKILDFYLDDDEQIIQKQLLLNYCLSAPNSNVLLFPVAPGVGFVNHHSKRANVRLDWSNITRLMKNHDALLSMDPHEILLDMFRPHSYAQDSPPVNTGFPAVGGLVMDMIAIRDIDEGEELFLDYGEAYEQAWESYVAQSSDKPGLSSQAHAVHFNHLFLAKPLPTDHEQAAEPLPDHVVLKVFVVNPRHGPDMILLEDASNVLKIHSRRPVNLQLTDWVYDIEVDNPAFDPEEIHLYNKQTLELTGVPHSRFFFVDVHGTSPLYAKEPFRHPIDLPEEMFPEQWKNKKNEAVS